MFTKDQLNAIAALLQAGRTDPEIAAFLGVSVNQFRYGVLKCGRSIKTRRELVESVPALPSEEAPLHDQEEVFA